MRLQCHRGRHIWLADPAGTPGPSSSPTSTIDREARYLLFWKLGLPTSPSPGPWDIRSARDIWESMWREVLLALPPCLLPWMWMLGWCRTVILWPWSTVLRPKNPHAEWCMKGNFTRDGTAVFPNFHRSPTSRLLVIVIKATLRWLFSWFHFHPKYSKC